MAVRNQLKPRLQVKADNIADPTLDVIVNSYIIVPITWILKCLFMFQVLSKAQRLYVRVVQANNMILDVYSDASQRMMFPLVSQGIAASINLQLPVN